MTNDWASGYSSSEKRALERAFWEHHIGHQRAQKILFGLEKPDAAFEETWAQFCQRISEGEPYQYVLGSVEFARCSLNIDNNVLIPRPETEQLVFLAHNSMPETGRFLDIGTGSGAIALGLAKALPKWEAFACDVSHKALSIAAANAKQNDLMLHTFECDITAIKALPHTPFDAIVSNPPYIPERLKSTMDNVVTEHEPQIALFVPNERPLLFYERIIKLAESALTPNGLLAFETHFDGAQEVVNILDKRTFTNIEIKKDYNGHERFVFARRR